MIQLVELITPCFILLRQLLSVKEIYPKAHKGVIAKFGLEFVKKGFIDDTYGRTLSHTKTEEKWQITI